MNRVVVRNATAADLAEVVRLERRTPEASHWPEGGYVLMLDQGSADDAVRRRFLVAQAAGRLVGFAVGRAAGRGVEGFAELETVVVEFGARRAGVGRALCEGVIAWCLDLGLGRLELEVRAGSAGAIALYRSLKFVAVGSRPGYYRDPDEDALLMELEFARWRRDGAGL